MPVTEKRSNHQLQLVKKGHRLTPVNVVTSKLGEVGPSLAPAAKGAYFCDFLWARLPAATPEQAAEDGRAPSAEPAVGSAMAVSRKRCADPGAQVRPDRPSAHVQTSANRRRPKNQLPAPRDTTMHCRPRAVGAAPRGSRVAEERAFSSGGFVYLHPSGRRALRRAVRAQLVGLVSHSSVGMAVIACAMTTSLSASSRGPHTWRV